MDVLTLLGADCSLASRTSKTHTPPDPSPTKSSSNSKGDHKSNSDNVASRDDAAPSTIQEKISENPTRHFPLRPQLSHRHSSINSRHSTSSVEKAAPVSSASTDSMESSSAFSVPYCSRCGLLRVQSALHPNNHTCHTPLVTGDPDHDLTSHLGPESLGQRSRLIVEDGRSFDSIPLLLDKEPSREAGVVPSQESGFSMI